MSLPQINRRAFVARSAAAATGLAISPAFIVRAAEQDPPHQAMGTRAGDVTPTSAVVWTRLTQQAARQTNGAPVLGREAQANSAAGYVKANVVDGLEGACPGVPGRVQLRYGTDKDLRNARATGWATVSSDTDYTHHFALANLKSGATYYYVSECSSPDGLPGSECRGRFQTAPPTDSLASVRFCVMTCQDYLDRGHVDGHHIYPAMLSLDPNFACLTGDLVYYDHDPPRADSVRVARYQWERMFSLPRLIEFNRNVATYWLKDDHDTLNDDTWPGKSVGEFTFADGQRIFRQQAPMADGPDFRTFRWGRDLQIWLTDGRDFRSPNNLPDGPQKTIWGAVQKAWFKQTVLASDATWKVLISPTPLVGPDRPQGKSDNHSNASFRHEGDELRNWLKEHVPNNFFVICGDRHWQYHSIHPQTGLREFSVGPASDEHAGGSPGEDPRYHRFHRVRGGFLSVSVHRADGVATIQCQHHDVHGKVVHEWHCERAIV